MKWVGRLMTSVAAMLLTTGGLSASTVGTESAPDAAWAAAVRSDSLEAYAAFAMMYPESPQAAAAYAKLSGTDTASMIATELAGASFRSDDGSTTSSPGMLPGTIMLI
jgi:hypothetical protein